MSAKGIPAHRKVVMGTTSYACKTGKHSGCYKLSCSCECHKKEQDEVMGKVIDFLQVPEAPGSHPHGEKVRAGGGCKHERLTFKDKIVECRSCGRQWKDYGTGGRK